MTRAFQTLLLLVLAAMTIVVLVLHTKSRNQSTTLDAQKQELLELRQQLDAASQQLRQMQRLKEANGAIHTEAHSPLKTAQQHQTALLESLKQENRRLAQQLAAATNSMVNTPPGVSSTTSETTRDENARSSIYPPRENTNPTQRDKFEAAICANHLKQIQIAAGIWAAQHENRWPPDLASLKDLLAPMILVCPSAGPKSKDIDFWETFGNTWQRFDPKNITYGFRAEGFPFFDHQGRGIDANLAYCPLHQFAILASGSGGTTSRWR